MAERKPALPIRYIVECYTPQEVITAPGMPVIGEPLDWAGGAFVHTIDIRADADNPLKWIADIMWKEPGNEQR